jgi:hypothetical protein
VGQSCSMPEQCSKSTRAKKRNASKVTLCL